MLHLYQSNQLEALSSALVRVIEAPLSDPLQPETIVVQHPGMERWLSQQIARQTGIAANLNFPLPATFIWDIFESTGENLPGVSAFKRDVLLWRIMDWLDTPGSHPAMREIAHYLNDDDKKHKQFQLATKITRLFDQYLIYRPEMILRWEQGNDRHWQADLWRELNTQNEASTHWAHLLWKFHSAVDAGALNAESLPWRICFFGISALAPAYLKVLDAISSLTEVHLFHFSPCEEAWDDIVSEQEQAKRRKKINYKAVDETRAYFTSGNSLLASMGKAGRDFFSLLMDLNPVEQDLYQRPKPDSLLHTIQSDILNLRDRNETRDSKVLCDDRSVAFHSCHSPMREVQVLHDRLLDLFAEDPGLKPADILVMAPDINKYAPFISGVFGAPGGTHYIPWAIADLARPVEHPAIEAFLGLLALPGSRFTAAEVMALLETRAIAARFKLDSDALSNIRSRIPEAGIRWGLDKTHRTQQGVDESGMQTWAFGLERLLLGYMTGPLDSPLQEVMPFGGMLTGSETWLGGMAAFVQALQELQKALHQAHSPDDWYLILNQMLEVFFDDSEQSEDLESLRSLRESINTFRSNCEQAAYTHPLNLALISQYFGDEMSGNANAQAFLSGKVSFCSMIPLRSITSKVICLLGMNDSAYPRSERPLSFDLMAAEPRPGDRNQREADRYLFLEMLLQAREHLHISWVGQNLHTNDNQPPSALVAELRDTIDRGWTPPHESSRKKCAELLTQRHPLHAFSNKCFDAKNPAIASYNKTWLPLNTPPIDPLFISSPLEPVITMDDAPVDMRELARFWNHPIRYFLQQRLGLNLRKEEEQLAETEAFSLDNLNKYLLTDQLVATKLAGLPEEADYHRMQAAGELPRSELGQVHYAKLQSTAHTMATVLQPLTEQPVEQVVLNLNLSGRCLNGRLHGLHTTGRVSYRAAKCSPKDLMQLWVHHLALLLTRPEGVALKSTHVATDFISSFSEASDPARELERLLIYFHQGVNSPLHFYSRTSFEWARTKNPEAKLNAARKKWCAGRYNPFAEETDIAHKIALRGLALEDLLDDQFEQLAALFNPILAHLEQDNAAI